MKKKVLFVCIHNSARSQMAEAFLNRMCPDHFEAQSAGLEPGTLNPAVVEAMREIGYDLSANRTKSVFDMLERREEFDFVIAVCDGANAERCPVFAGGGQRIHWSFPDPSAFKGTLEERLPGVREVRDAIQRKIQQWCEAQCEARTS